MKVILWQGLDVGCICRRLLSIVPNQNISRVCPAILFIHSL